ncbi:MAG: FAD-dependent oxidoreductase [Lentisphaerae bacterium]|nr:FAD-dependent oxidoreductase [Lentisphaerota bacterium]
MTNQQTNKVTAWRCVVCGYIHHGESPPEFCPVCNAPASEFEPYAKSEPDTQPVTAGKWRCLVCGYEHEGDGPPDTCPVCGVGSNRFESIPVAEATNDEKRPEVRHVVVLGGGIAGISAAESARKHMPDIKITLVTAEMQLPYYRINLTRYLAGEIEASSLPLHPEDWYKSRQIDFISGVEAKRIDLEQSEVVLENGTRISYDKLILALGAHPYVPSFPGTQFDGVTTLRNREDTDCILSAVSEGASCVIVGSGILGLETAGGIARRGGKVTLLEQSEYLMPRQLNRAAAGLLLNRLNDIGIDCHLNAKVSELIGNGHVTGVRLKSGELLPADLVVIATGVRSNTKLAVDAGLKVNHGVLVDDFLYTSNPDILAAGDVAEHRGLLYGTWSAAQSQGIIAGMNAGGAQAEFGGIPRAHTLKVLGLNLVSIGVFEPLDDTYRIVAEEKDGFYSCFVFKDNKIAGSILLGNSKSVSFVKKAIENNKDCSVLFSKQPTVDEVLKFLKDT